MNIFIILSVNCSCCRGHEISFHPETILYTLVAEFIVFIVWVYLRIIEKRKRNKKA